MAQNRTTLFWSHAFIKKADYYRRIFASMVSAGAQQREWARNAETSRLEVKGQRRQRSLTTTPVSFSASFSRSAATKNTPALLNSKRANEQAPPPLRLSHFNRTAFKRGEERRAGVSTRRPSPLLLCSSAKDTRARPQRDRSHLRYPSSIYLPFRPPCRVEMMRQQRPQPAACTHPPPRRSPRPVEAGRSCPQ